ncbi:hypothetical protein NDU88_002387 [Pleurodeles waltl]|uniref:Uncharacterized protein n=1 Tax=Pleurodeles waltl TaxID=8319 RepID=A0AAV7W4E5_PLEWA|nr:hypothetical protein NDU88_002387 [Pleurodeles waltl]
MPPLENKTERKMGIRKNPREVIKRGRTRDDGKERRQKEQRKPNEKNEDEKKAIEERSEDKKKAIGERNEDEKKSGKRSKEEKKTIGERSKMSDLKQSPGTLKEKPRHGSGEPGHLW